jgi:hypothetical protein
MYLILSKILIEKEECNRCLLVLPNILGSILIHSVVKWKIIFNCLKKFFYAGYDSVYLYSKWLRPRDQIFSDK